MFNLPLTLAKKRLSIIRAPAPARPSCHLYCDREAHPKLRISHHVASQASYGIANGRLDGAGTSFVSHPSLPTQLRSCLGVCMDEVVACKGPSVRQGETASFSGATRQCLTGQGVFVTDTATSGRSSRSVIRPRAHHPKKKKRKKKQRTLASLWPPFHHRDPWYDREISNCGASTFFVLSSWSIAGC